MKRFRLSARSLASRRCRRRRTSSSSRSGAAAGRIWSPQTAAKKFTADTGVQVEFVTGGTIDRLNKAKLAKGNPGERHHLHDVACRLALRQRRPVRDARPDEGSQHGQPGRAGQDQPAPHRHLGLRLHHRLSARPRAGRHQVRQLGRSVEARAEGQARRRPTSTPAIWSQSQPSSKAAMRQAGRRARRSSRRSSPTSRPITPTTPASQQLMQNGEAPVQVMLSMNAYLHRQPGRATLKRRDSEGRRRARHRHHRHHEGHEEGGARLQVHQYGARSRRCRPRSPTSRRAARW